jgi:hypothetical protein
MPTTRPSIAGSLEASSEIERVEMCCGDRLDVPVAFVVVHYVATDGEANGTVTVTFGIDSHKEHRRVRVWSLSRPITDRFGTIASKSTRT